MLQVVLCTVLYKNTILLHFAVSLW